MSQAVPCSLGFSCRRPGFAVILLAILLGCSCGVYATPTYSVTRLDDGLGGLLGSVGWGINNQGRVVGQASPNFAPRGFQAQSEMTLFEPSAQGGSVSVARDINDSGTIVGYGQFTTGLQTRTSLFWTQNGVTYELPELPQPHWQSYGMAINASGTMVGYTIDSSGFASSLVYDLDDGLRILSPGQGSKAWDINASGTIVGATLHGFGQTQAYLSDGVNLTQLGGLPGGGSSFATAINDHNVVVGYAQSGSGSNKAVMRNSGDSQWTILEGIADVESSFAHDINSSGVVVGSYATQSGAAHAFLYTDESGMISLNSLIDPASGWLLTSAEAINDLGQITGVGYFHGERRAYRLDTTSLIVPEPTGVVLAMLGLTTLLLHPGLRARLTDVCAVTNHRPEGTNDHC